VLAPTTGGQHSIQEDAAHRVANTQNFAISACTMAQHIIHLHAYLAPKLKWKPENHVEQQRCLCKCFKLKGGTEVLSTKIKPLEIQMKAGTASNISSKNNPEFTQKKKEFATE
jgi:hypothetical protein